LLHPSIHPSILHPLCNKDLVHGLRHNLRYALLAELDEGIALAEGLSGCSQVPRRGSMTCIDMAVCQNLVPLVNIKIAGKWMFIPLKMVLIGIDPYPHVKMS
jgi:hypothetical protein